MGRQRRRSARTFQEARDLKSRLKSDVRSGEFREQSRETFASYAGDWLDTYTGRTARGIRPATLADYRASMERDAIPFLGRMRMGEIEPRHIRQLAAHIAGRGVSGNTVRLALAPVKACFATAVEDGVLRSNPCSSIRISRQAAADVDDEKVKALTEDELQRFLAKVDQAYRPLFELLAHTGLRISEALALEWRDIDLGQRRLRVRRRLYKGALAPPKSRYGRREIPLSDGATRTLWQLRKTSPAPADADPVFVTATGDRLDRGNLYSRVLKPATRAAGIPWAAFHTFRHTCATMLFRHGLNAVQVQLWLGHHSPGFTMATYVHLLPEDLPAADFLDALTNASPAVAMEPEREARGA